LISEAVNGSGMDIELGEDHCDARDRIAEAYRDWPFGLDQLPFSEDEEGDETDLKALRDMRHAGNNPGCDQFSGKSGSFSRNIIFGQRSAFPPS
jgi:hypothetical protein